MIETSNKTFDFSFCVVVFLVIDLIAKAIRLEILG